MEYLLNTSPWDEKLYDVVIPMDKTNQEEAVKLILTGLQSAAVKTTPESQKVLDNQILANKVNVELIKSGYDTNVSNEDGKITISLKTYVIRMGHMKEKLSKIAESVPGVNSANVVLGPNVKVPSRYDELKSPTPRFLLVDDEKEFVQTLSERLRVREFDSKIAYDGEEALTYLEKNEPDVMILDLKMPGIDGMEVLRKVKKERPHVEVIILTGHGSEKDRSLAMELGAFAYLEKPVNIDVLTKTMKEAYNKIEQRK
jgi:CheY-like chemotaxis protein